MSIKILHCMHALHGGGAERQLTILANNKNNNSMRFGIFCVNDSICQVDRENSDILIIEDAANYPFGMIKEISKAIDKFKPDIVHVWLPPSVSAPALIAAKLKKKKTVASYRNKKIFESWIRIPEFLTTLFFADAIVSNNPPEQSSYLFRKLFHYKKNIVIPNAVMVSEEYKKNNYSLNSEALKILFVGRITHQKNWQTLLRSLAAISRDKKWKLQVCGKGEDESRFKDMAKKLGIFSNIEMLGYQENVYSYMKHSDLLVLPSWYEGMPNVVLEAMTIGLPCIVSNIPAHTTLFDDGSGVIFFNPDNASELTEEITNIIDKRIDLEELSNKGLKFSERFTPNIMLSQYERFYTEVLKK